MPQESYLDLLTEDVDLLFLCSPDNPSGAVIPKDFLLQILKTCEEKEILMVLDECFVEFLAEPEKQTLYRECRRSRNLVILQAFRRFLRFRESGSDTGLHPMNCWKQWKKIDSRGVYPVWHRLQAVLR